LLAGGSGGPARPLTIAPQASSPPQALAATGGMLSQPREGGAAAGRELLARAASISSPHNPSMDTTGNRTIFVKGTTAFMAREDILGAFAQFGKIVHFNDKHYGDKGFVHVHFSTVEECQKALAAKRVTVPQRPLSTGEPRMALSLLINAARTATAGGW
jgi:hypothetical protein